MIGVGVGVGLAPEVPQAAGGGSNPNLLLFPEAFDNAVWVKTATGVTANLSDGVNANADQLAMSGTAGIVTQTTAVAVGAGSAAGLDVALTPFPVRSQVSGTFGGVAYTFSVVLSSEDVGQTVFLLISRVGGVLQVMLTDSDATDPTFTAWGAKLEQAPAFTTYP